jgi:sec-independent protein translocase protein TatB
MTFFGLGPLEILLIVVLALIVFGPAKLPEIMGQVGKAIADFRRATSELSDEFNRTIQTELQETKAIVDDTKSTFTGTQASINAALGTAPAVAAAAPALATTAPSLSNGTNSSVNGANGTTSAAVADPAPAPTPQWSYETSGPAPTQPAVVTGDSSPATSSAPGPVLPTPSVAQPPTTRKSSRRDDLLPPY